MLIYFTLLLNHKSKTYILATSVSIAIGLNASTEKTTPTRATKAEAKHSVII
jgi:hypothetical protein